MIQDGKRREAISHLFESDVKLFPKLQQKLAWCLVLLFPQYEKTQIAPRDSESIA